MKQKEAAMPAQILHDLGQLPPRRTEALVDILRSHILTGELPPGQRLNLDEIAQQSGVSRMPVRDALKQLEAEGLVNIYPQRGIEVSALNIEDITQLFGIRIVLEQKAVELAIPRLTSEDHARMRDVLTKMDLLTGRSSSWPNFNAQFHYIINSASGWPRLISMISVLRANVDRYVREYVRMLGTEIAQRQHWDLYHACVDGDAERAKQVVHDHFSTTTNELLSALKAEDNSKTKKMP